MDRNGNLPLHTACLFNQSLEVIQFLVRQHPHALKEKTCQGFLPLHMACFLNVSPGMIQFLVEQHPHAVIEKELKGVTPLDLIQMALFDHPDAEIVKWMEAVKSGLIILPSLTPAPPRGDEEKVDGPSRCLLPWKMILPSFPRQAQMSFYQSFLPHRPDTIREKLTILVPSLQSWKRISPRSPPQCSKMRISRWIAKLF